MVGGLITHASGDQSAFTKINETTVRSLDNQHFILS